MYYSSFDVVKVGDTVTYELNGKKRTHKILPFTQNWKPVTMGGAYESSYNRPDDTTGANPNEGTISEKAPLAQALLGKHVGESFSYVVNDRNFSGEIISIDNRVVSKLGNSDIDKIDNVTLNDNQSKRTGGRLCIKQEGFYYNVTGNDALLLHKYFGYKVYGVNQFRTGFPVIGRDTVLKKIDDLAINYDVYDKRGEVIVSKSFSPNNYEILNPSDFPEAVLRSSQRKGSTPKGTTEPAQTEYARILQCLHQGVDPFTGEIVSGIDAQTQKILLEMLVHFGGVDDSLPPENDFDEPIEYKTALGFNQEFEALLAEDKFIARSDYKQLLETYETTYTFFNSAVRARTLSYYCEQNKVQERVITKFLNYYEDILDLQRGSSFVAKHNDEYVNNHLESEKLYLDTVLSDVDSNILLDDDQRKAVLSDEDYSLVIAGAGAGKTTTVAAKVKYLVDKKNIAPEEILVISYTNKAVGELQERINAQLKIPCPITTFHSTGNAILRKQDDEKKKIATEGFLYNCVNEYLKRNILSQPTLVDKLVMFFGSYFDTPYEGDDINLFFNYVAKADFTTLRSNIDEYNEQIIDRRTGQIKTISSETLRSVQEVKIANFLYLNQIDYKYEEIYPYHILKAKKPYTPDFCIRQGNKVAYIEHFGITENGRHSFYSAEELGRYKQEIQDKIALHKAHGSTLIYTYSQYNDGRDFIEHLREQLETAGFILKARPTEEVFKKLVQSEENKYIAKLVKLICVFIVNFKTNGFELGDFYRLSRTSANVRSKLFLEICEACYLEYQKQLLERNAIDFQDMINESARILREKRIAHEELPFKYIIVDEYQDISRQRFDLTKELSTICKAKIIAVGDDWQSIYAFSGSDVTLFTHFCSIMGYGQELKITRTYRNAQEVIDIAGYFVQKNDSQIKKTLVSPKHIQKPVIVETYSEDFDRKKYAGRGGKYFLLGKKVEELVGVILQQNAKEGKSANSSILLIGRFGFDARNLCFSNDFVYDENNGKISSKKYPRARLEFLTAHSSKGLGYDNVIIINARNEIYGFPAKIDDDPVLKYVVKDDTSIEYAEERRLFYVAMTRTKNRVYIVTPEKHPSEFILELIKDYPDITVHGDINKNNDTNIGLIKRCPVCGFPLQFRYKPSYGLSLWICTNEPEVCNFISNDLSGGEMSIQKCDWCRDGYLIVKKGPSGGAFLGCTNYEPDGTGCNRTVNSDNYKTLAGGNFEPDESVEKPTYQTVVPTPQMPKVKHDKQRTTSTERKKVDVHKIHYELIHFGPYGFSVIADDEGNIITDLELLDVLHKLRYELMQETHQSSVAIVTNTGLVSLATYRPETREEFISLSGLGEGTYNAYGARFIKAIKDFYAKK